MKMHMKINNYNRLIFYTIYTQVSGQDLDHDKQ